MPSSSAMNLPDALRDELLELFEAAMGITPQDRIKHMKFSQLQAQHRSALAAIANAGPLTTDKLAKTMQLSAQQAAHQLCAMRKVGLCFSHQKTPGQQYCVWEVTTLGQALFDGRPDAELSVDQGKATVASKMQAITKFCVVAAPGFDNNTGTKEQAIMAAQHAALTNNQQYYVVGLVAEVTPPEQPQAVVTML